MSSFLLDQHVHLNGDDAKHPIEYVAKCAAEQGLISLGPIVHDHVGHMEHSVQVMKDCGIPYPLAATEIFGQDGHYVMMFPDFRAANDQEFKTRLQKIYDGRRNKLENLAESTQKAPFIMNIDGFGRVDFSFTIDDLERVSNDGRILSGHLSQRLSELTGGRFSGKEAYDMLQDLFAMEEYRSSALYAESLFSLDELVHYKERFGALLVEAHRPDSDWSLMTPKLKKGLDGFEISSKYHPANIDINRRILEYAKQHGFLLTYGTDNHMWENEVLGYQNVQPGLVGRISAEENLEKLIKRLRPIYL